MDCTTKSTDMSLSKFQEMGKDREVWHAAVHGAAESDTTEQLNNNNHCHNSDSGYKPSSLPLDLKGCK